MYPFISVGESFAKLPFVEPWRAEKDWPSKMRVETGRVVSPQNPRKCELQYDAQTPQLGGGNSNNFWMFTRFLGKWSNLTFQMGWFNHQQDNREQWEFPCFWIFDYQETLTREEQTRIQQPRPDSKRQEKVDLKRKPWDFWLQSGYSRGIEKQNTTLEKITVLSPRTLRQHRCKIIQPKNKWISITKLDWDMIRYLYIRYLEVYCFGHQHTKFIENMKKSQTKLRSHPILGVLTSDLEEI